MTVHQKLFRRRHGTVSEDSRGRRAPLSESTEFEERRPYCRLKSRHYLKINEGPVWDENQDAMELRKTPCQFAY
jgi:hypothetical protein